MTHGTAGIQYGFWMQFLGDPLGDLSEKGSETFGFQIVYTFSVHIILFIVLFVINEIHRYPPVPVRHRYCPA